MDKMPPRWRAITPWVRRIQSRQSQPWQTGLLIKEKSVEKTKEFSLPSVYDPKTVESRWYEEWEKSGIFTASQDSAKPSFSMVIPPPNGTGSLHIGDALNNTLQTLSARFKPMQGFNILGLPAVYPARITTQ